MLALRVKDIDLQRQEIMVRRGFEHFSLSGRSIEAGGLPKILGQVLVVTHRIAFAASSLHQYSETQKRRLKKVFSDLARRFQVSLPTA